MGLIGNAEIISPPKDLLGKFTRSYEPDLIVDWIQNQDLKSFAAAIVSLDMLAYGGLVAFSVYQTKVELAMQRVKIIQEIKKSASNPAESGRNPEAEQKLP